VTVRVVRSMVVLLVAVVWVVCANAADVTKGLAGHWRLDEAWGSSVLDDVSQMYGTVFDALWTTGISGAGLYFDGVTGYVNLGNAPALNLTQAMTVLLWVQLDRVGVEAYELVRKPGAYTLYAYVARDTCQIMGSIVIDGKDRYPQGVSSIPFGEWHMVGFVYGDIDGSGVSRIANVVDGILGRSALLQGSIQVSDKPLLLNPRRLDRGFVDELRIYNRALTGSELLLVYTNQRP